MTPAEILQRKRRVSLTVEEMVLISATLAVSLAHFPLAISLKDRLTAAVDEERDPEHRRTVDAYRAAVETKDGQIELDDDAEISLGDDPGAYVMVWAWVPAEDAGLCRTCSAAYDGCGDGYDGECPDCADLTEAAQEPDELDDENEIEPSAD